MFRRQDEVLKDFRVVEEVEEGEGVEHEVVVNGLEKVGDQPAEAVEVDAAWDDGEEEDGERCDDCGLRLPPFAMSAHRRYHYNE